MAIHPVCNVVRAAMAKTGLSYKGIAEKTDSLSEAQVEELCAGRKIATSEEHDAISKALGLSTIIPASDQPVCSGRDLHPKIPPDHPSVFRVLSLAETKITTRHHDAFDTIGLLHHRTALVKRAIESARLKSFGGNILPDHLKIKITEQFVRTGLVGSDDLNTFFSHDGFSSGAYGFTWFRLKNIIQYTADTSRFDFGFDDPDIISVIPVSSTCVVTAPDDKALYERDGTTPRCTIEGRDSDRVNVYRAYTPITEHGAMGILSLAIKKQPATDAEAKYPGLMSNYIHGMKIGDTLGIMGYLQRAPSMVGWDVNNTYEKVTLIAAGIGITPIYQIIQYSLAKKSNKTEFILLYQNSTEADIALLHELDAFQIWYPDNFKVVYFISNKTGRLGQTGIQDNAHAPGVCDLVCVAGPLPFLQSVCGPRDVAADGSVNGFGELTGYLKNLKYDAKQVHKF